MNRLLDAWLELRISLAKWRMLAHERGRRRAADQMALLIGRRGSGQVDGIRRIHKAAQGSSYSEAIFRSGVGSMLCEVGK